ncbi:MAG: hypothetical protein M9963_10480 [Kiritimatiellae bacterium]|nr:hypothetical protein [Kiritimatiellia bacterium]MCO5062401.1 hypothetical protein [Kiritimatiellia bacterium]MCO6400617.1 hypothetical protein [Verrucomicrobiota bacterium]
MQIAADTHVHLYPFYDLSAQLTAAVANLRRAAPAAEILALCLTERSGQAAFSSLREGALSAAGWTLSAPDDPDALIATSKHGSLTLIAGRQIVTAERLEVLALGRDLRVPDGLSLDETLGRIEKGDAIATLPWGFGKWLGRRGALIQNLLDTDTSHRLVFADTCLRPAWVPTPQLLRKAQARGFPILYGSDPLPRLGEELITGRLATLWDAPWKNSHPAAAWRQILRDTSPGQSIGRRCSVWEALKRLR